MEIGNIAEQNKGFRYLLNCIDIYTVCKKKNGRIENQFQKRTDIIGLHPGESLPGKGAFVRRFEGIHTDGVFKKYIKEHEDL